MSSSPALVQASNSSRRRGIVEITLSGICFGFLGIFGKLAYRSGVTIGELLTFRFALAALAMALALVLVSPRRLRISGRQLGICAGLGVLGYAVFASFYFKAIEGVSVALASLLLYTYPVIVALGSRFLFGERLTRIQLIALPTAILGLGLLLFQGPAVDSHEPWAIGAGLASALCYATYILASSRLQRQIDPLTSGLYVMSFAALGLLAIHRPDLGRVFEFDSRQAAIIFGIALICTVAPLVLFLSGLQRLTNTEASLLSTVEPLTAAGAGILILGEGLESHELIGGFLILTALITTAAGSGQGRKSQLAAKTP